MPLDKAIDAETRAGIAWLLQIGRILAESDGGVVPQGLDRAAAAFVETLRVAGFAKADVVIAVGLILCGLAEDQLERLNRDGEDVIERLAAEPNGRRH